MHYLVAILSIFFLVGSVLAQMPMVPEHEILKISDSILTDKEGLPEVKGKKCGSYFLYYEDSEVPLILLVLKTSPFSKKEVIPLILMQKRNVEVRLDGSKDVPTAEISQGPKLIIRIKQADYKKSVSCLPRPQSA